MKLHSPWIVAITIAVVIALNALGRDGGRPQPVYVDESIDSLAWHRDDLPPDRWIGIVLDEAGWERLPSEVGVPWINLGSPAAPAFDGEVAVVAYMGAMPTGGYAIALKSVEYTPAANGGGGTGQLLVQIAVASPAPGDMVTQAFTYPAAVTWIAKESWPEGVLDGLASGRVELIVVDQDGRSWGPAHVVAGAP